MIRKIIGGLSAFAIMVLLLVQSVRGQESLTVKNEIETYLKEIKIESKKYQRLWAKDLYAPILLVNPNTRQAFANFADTNDALKKDGNIYSGTLPDEINIANTAIDWNGRKWTMLMLPLPADKFERINLLAHELFHVSQPALGFKLFNTDNNHLDRKDGRVYLRLELEALKKSIQTTDKTEQKKHLTNAAIFRKYRYSLYSGADATENSLELNEGIAEYTGFVISGRNKKQTVEHFEHSLNLFFNNSTFVRSFAYQTIPMYGYLLAQTKSEWNKKITVETNLTDYFIREFNLSIPPDLKKATDSILNKYNGELITAEETAREEKTKKLIALYKEKFVDQPHFEIVFEQMQVSFDPSNIMPLENMGTVYPNMRISDKWGILTVENGVLMSPNWDKVSVSEPVHTDNKNVSGYGWILELKNGYSVVKDEETGNYKLFLL